jgi:hypothetical protein
MEAFHFTHLCLSKMQCTQKSNLLLLQPSRSSLLINSVLPCSLIWIRRACQRLVLLGSSELTSKAIPGKVLPQKHIFLQNSYHLSWEQENLLIPLELCWYLYTCTLTIKSTKTLYDIKFLSMVVMCFTQVNVCHPIMSLDQNETSVQNMAQNHRTGPIFVTENIKQSSRIK